MSRDPGNVNIWQDARIWTATGSGARPALPTDASTPVDEDDWFELGILDGDAGIGEERSSDETEHFGWGIGLIKIGNKNFKLSRTFSALEDNDTTRGILWPGSTATALYMPKPVYRYLGFETVSDLGVTERLWTVKPARLSVPGNNRNESDITKLEITANIFGDGTGKLFDRQYVDASTPLPPTIGSLDPASVAAAGGDLVRVEGSKFTGTTGVTVGGTAAPEFAVIDDDTLVFVTPAQTAGTHAVVVTNAAGPSAGVDLTVA